MCSCLQDHSGYHSQPVPDYATAASSRALASVPAADDTSYPALSKREGSSPSLTKVYQTTDNYRFKETAPKKTVNKVGVDKDSGLDKDEKNYQYYEKQTFEYRVSNDGAAAHQGKESPSAFPHLLGYNPYLPPEINVDPHTPQSSGASTPSSVIGRSDNKLLPQQEVTTSVPRTSFPTSTFGHRSEVEESTHHRPVVTKTSLADDTEAIKSRRSATPLSESSILSSLSVDLESGQVYNEETGTWYKLVPILE